MAKWLITFENGYCGCSTEEIYEGDYNDAVEFADEYLPDYKLVINKAILPTKEELENNNRARSAKLRVIERIK